MAALMLFTTSSCEDNFDAKIYGKLLQGKYPSTESEYVSYMMICYLPFTTPFTYTINEGTGMHGWYIATGGDIRFFDSTSDIMAPGYTAENGFSSPKPTTKTASTTGVAGWSMTAIPTIS